MSATAPTSDPHLKPNGGAAAPVRNGSGGTHGGNPPGSRPHTSTTGATLANMRHRVGRSLLFVGLVCTGIAILLTAMSRDHLVANLVYSFAIGYSCTFFTEGVRLLMALLADGWRRLRRLPAMDTGIANGFAGLLPAGIVGVWLGVPLGMGIADLFTGQRSPSLWNLWSLQSGSARFTLTISTLAMVVTITVVGMIERLQRARADAEAAQRQAAENQLRLLQSQLEPHMLFNTLANLRVLIGLDPARAQAMLDRLIAFLRGTLAASRARSHPLAEEFRHTEDYLELMGVRMGPRLAVALHLPDELKAMPVPPLLLQPLVENAIKHGLEPKVEGGRIEVRARREGTTLVLEVRDSGLGLGATPAEGSRFGLAQVRERLATLHGEAATLTLHPREDGAGAVATVRLPLPPG